MSNDLALFPGVKLTRTSLELTKHMSYETWQQIGATLEVMSGSVQWWIGDWLNEGEKAYGEKYSQAVDEKQADLWKDYSWVANNVQKSLRNDDLSWWHHREVAPLRAEEQSQWLAKAAEKDWSVRDFRTELRKAKVPQLGEVALPSGKFRIFYADPPWSYGNVMPAYFTEQQDHYSLMSLEDICALPVKDLAQADAVLFLWATSPILKEAFAVIEAWGFEYKTSFVWDKVKHNMGHYNSVRHEFLLVCTRGACVPDVPKLFDSVITEERTEHSRKPAKFYDIIDTLYTHGERLELFLRGTPRKGWKGFGNQIHPE